MKITAGHWLKARWKGIRGRYRKWSRQLTRRQRRALLALGIANLIVLGLLATLLLRPFSPSGAPPANSPLAPQRIQACRRQVSRALLEANQRHDEEPLTTMVQTQADGTILLQVQCLSATSSLRGQSDAAVWMALEAVAASQSACLNFQTIRVEVLFPSLSFSSRATARLSLPDLLLWSFGEIDDAELARRIDYRPPAQPLATPTPTPALNRNP